MQAICTNCKKDITNLVNLYFEGKIETPKCNCKSHNQSDGGVPASKK